MSLMLLIQSDAPTISPTTMPAGLEPWLIVPTQWPATTDLLEWCHMLNAGTAALLLVGGIVYLLFGYYLFKGLITLNAALAGAYVGAIFGKLGEAVVPGAFIGAFIAAAVCWPMMRWAVAITGALIGFILGIAVWRAIGLDPSFSPAGGAVGLVFFGMISFILFKGSVMMFTSVQGASMIIVGALGLLQKYQEIAPTIQKSLEQSPVILPMAVFVPAVIGLIYQQSTGEAEAAKKK
ncbi:MAG TPA: hypothetical protein PKB10_11315 [Tepidisphaeraceae bacterium]|nr:hypothetical protein [Tepidisphaeraceae bacterium]